MTVAHIVNAALALFPDVVWIFLAYVALLDVLKYVRRFRVVLKASGGLVSKGGLAKALLSLFDGNFFIITVVEDATAQHAGTLAVAGFMAGLASGQGLKAAALGAILGAATASVADAKETFWKSFKETFGAV